MCTRPVYCIALRLLWLKANGHNGDFAVHRPASPVQVCLFTRQWQLPRFEKQVLSYNLTFKYNRCRLLQLRIENLLLFFAISRIVQIKSNVSVNLIYVDIDVR